MVVRDQYPKGFLFFFILSVIGGRPPPPNGSLPAIREKGRLPGKYLRTAVRREAGRLGLFPARRTKC